MAVIDDLEKRIFQDLIKVQYSTTHFIEILSSIKSRINRNRLQIALHDQSFELQGLFIIIVILRTNSNFDRFSGEEGELDELRSLIKHILVSVELSSKR